MASSKTSSPSPRGRSARSAGSEKRSPKRSPLRNIKKKPPKDVPIGPKQIRHLRGLGHSLDPVVHVGKAGVTEEVLAAVAVQLSAHELIKLKLSSEDREERKELAEALARGSKSVLAQILGRTVLLYKRHPKNPKIVLPRSAAGESTSAAQPQTSAAKPLAADADFEGDDEEQDDEEDFEGDEGIEDDEDFEGEEDGDGEPDDEDEIPEA